MPSRSPYGERGLKSRVYVQFRHAPECRSPYGERGLKCRPARDADNGIRSLPVWGAWIEMFLLAGDVIQGRPSLPVWGAWIEMPQKTHEPRPGPSRSPYGERGLK